MNKELIMTNEKYKKFYDLFSKLDPKKEKIAIFMHKDPDPDAIGSAFGVRWILSKLFNLESTIFFDGEIVHRQNQTLLNVLNIVMSRFSEYNPTKYTKIILVDTPLENSILDRANVIIDHHKSNKIGEEDILIVESVGAASTIIWEMITDFDLTLCKTTDEDLATLLFFGIRTDTQELLSEGSTDRDWNAYKSLSDLVDRQKVTQIVQYSFPSYLLEVEKHLFDNENKKEHQGLFICGLGYLSPGRKGVLPTLTEKVTRIEGYETAVIFAIIENNLVASVRSTNNSIDIDRFCRKVFGEEYGGGRRGAGGATVPLGLLGSQGLDDDLKDRLWKTIRDICFQRIMHRALGK